MLVQSSIEFSKGSVKVNLNKFHKDSKKDGGLSKSNIKSNQAAAVVKKERANRQGR